MAASKIISKMLLFLVLSSALLYCDVEAQLEYSLQDARVGSLSEEYFDPSTTNIDTEEDDDQEYLTISLGVLKDIPEDTMFKLEVLERTVDAPKSIGLAVFENLCKVIEMTETPLAPILAEMNMQNCPVKKGTYTTSDFVLKASMLPDRFPVGQYLIRIKLVKDSQEILELNVFMSVP